MQVMWGKYDAESGSTHPLASHMLDVAHVAGILYDHRATTALRDALSRRDVMLLAALHDIGKATAHFQGQIDGGALVPGHLPYDPSVHLYGRGTSPYHESLGIAALLEMHGESPATTALARSLSVEHGTYPSDDMIDAAFRSLSREGAAWKDARRALVADLASELGVTDPGAPWADDLPPDLLIQLAGLVKIADWIGSHEGLFPHDPRPLHEYAPDSLRRAETACRRLRVTGTWHRPESGPSFESVFGFAPRPLQSAAWSAPIAGPELMILEDQMGAGKSEAAFGRVLRWAEHGLAGGLYVAMPTHATSAAIHPRLESFLRDSGLSTASAMLTHRDPDVVSAPSAWFRGAHRAIISSVGVGTVDHLLSLVLRTPYRMVGLASLAGRAVILDEVHGYDERMLGELESLLEHLAAMGCPVLALSATLRPGQAERMAAAYRRGLGERSVSLDLTGRPYPAMATSSRGRTEVAEVGRARPDMEVEISRSEVPAPSLVPRDVSGGVVAIVCNSVASAVDTYCEIRRDHPGALLLHSRLSPADRSERERELLRVAGRTGDRSEGLVVVATQIIESSLDIDADLMLTEPCPADSLAQRIGRLHRHERETRPPWGSAPKAVIVPGSAYVYERTVPHALIRTLEDLPGSLSTPEDIAPLVRSAFTPREEGDGHYDEALAEYRRSLRSSASRLRTDIAPSLAKASSARTPLGTANPHLPTRDGADSLSVIVLRDGEPAWESAPRSIIPVPHSAARGLPLSELSDRDSRRLGATHAVDASAYDPVLGLVAPRE